MNSRFLASPGGRFANLGLSLTFAVAAYASFCDGRPDALRWLAIGLLALIASFIVAAVLCVEEFHWYSLAIGVLVPMAGLYYTLGLQMVIGRGPGVGAALATVGVFVLLTGFVLGLRTAPASETASREVPHPATPRAST